jgi:hypothetical protein
LRVDKRTRDIPRSRNQRPSRKTQMDRLMEDAISAYVAKAFDLGHSSSAS